MSGLTVSMYVVVEVGPDSGPSLYLQDMLNRLTQLEEVVNEIETKALKKRWTHK